MISPWKWFEGCLGSWVGCRWLRAGTNATLPDYHQFLQHNPECTVSDCRGEEVTWSGLKALVGRPNGATSWRPVWRVFGWISWCTASIYEGKGFPAHHPSVFATPTKLVLYNILYNFMVKHGHTHIKKQGNLFSLVDQAIESHADSDRIEEAMLSSLKKTGRRYKRRFT